MLNKSKLSYYIISYFQTEESLTNLQRNIHPLALKNLRSLLDFNDKDWSSLINDLKNKEVPKSELNRETHLVNKLIEQLCILLPMTVHFGLTRFLDSNGLPKLQCIYITKIGM